MFLQIGKPLLEACLEGYNGTIFAYGQTGSGKTFTLDGGASENTKGLMPRIFEHLFDFITKKKEEVKKKNKNFLLLFLFLFN